jgi:hypothetical protein
MIEQLSLKRGIAFAAMLLAGASLTACSGVQKQLGLTRSAPDEFAVVSRAPLSIPPDYSLRPPTPGATRPQDTAITNQAEQTLFGRNGGTVSEPRRGQLASAATTAVERGGVISAAPSTSVETVSRGEDSLIRYLGADKAEPNIRQIVNAESTELALASESFADKILFWRKPEEPGTIVDAEAERRRLQENEALGKPADSGATPQIERKSKALLEGLLDF